jgi:drug/metabolite transporter (DMT)-like permease
MNVGLILTPVSIYQMSRGALVLWVGVLSVIFLRRRLWLYQWLSLVVVTLGVCLVGLSGSLASGHAATDDGLVKRLATIAITTNPEDDPARVALGVALILFAQIFTATQYVSFYLISPLLAFACVYAQADF